MIDLNTLHKMWADDSHIRENELDTSSINGAKLHSKYLELFNIARLKLKKTELKLAELKQKKWRYYTGKMSKAEMDELSWDYDPYKGSTKPMKAELNQYIEADEDIQKIKLKIEYAKIVAESIEEILNTLRWRHTVIKNIIDWKKFTSGV